MEMDRYYRILGIPNTASKEDIKRAYHEKMKALHPDKVHGTALEETAAFFSSEINEAYHALISNFNNGYSAARKNELIEEDIFIEGFGLLTYSLSNDLNTILKAIVKRTGYSINDTTDSMEWTFNTGLSENVKRTMNTRDMNYSMTTYLDGNTKKVIINKRERNNWYWTGYEIEMEYQANKTPTHHHSEFNKKRYRFGTYTNKKSNAKPGLFIGILNMLQLVYFYINRSSINLPGDNKVMIISGWIIISLIVAIVGFYISRKGYIEKEINIGYGIAGMFLNGIVILPIVLLGKIDKYLWQLGNVFFLKQYGKV